MGTSAGPAGRTHRIRPAPIPAIPCGQRRRACRCRSKMMPDAGVLGRTNPDGLLAKDRPGQPGRHRGHRNAPVQAGDLPNGQSAVPRPVPAARTRTARRGAGARGICRLASPPSRDHHCGSSLPGPNDGSPADRLAVARSARAAARPLGPARRSNDEPPAAARQGARAGHIAEEHASRRGTAWIGCGGSSGEGHRDGRLGSTAITTGLAGHGYRRASERAGSIRCELSVPGETGLAVRHRGCPSGNRRRTSP
jgi:hypothetical protein